MIEGLKSFLQTVSALLIFIGHSFRSLIRLFRYLPQYISFITTSLDVLPLVILPFALATISIYAVYFVLNKQ